MNTITSSAGSVGVGRTEIERLRRAARRGIVVEAAGAVAVLLTTFALASLGLDRWLRLEQPARAVLLAGLAAVVAWQLHRRAVRPLQLALSDDDMALAVERAAPEVRQSLISSLQFDRDLRGGAPGTESAAMKAAVVASVRRDVGAIPFARAIDARRVRRFAGAIVASALVFVTWAAVDANTLRLWAARNLALADAEWPRATTLVVAGDGRDRVRLARGDPLTLRVDVRGVVPDEVHVDYRFASGERGTELVSRTGEREFTWTIDTVLADVELELRGGDAAPVPVVVTIVERPRVDDLTVVVTWPDYMQREPETVPPTEGELQLPKGATLTITGRSDKPLAHAFVLFANEHRTPLALGPDARSFRGDFVPAASGLLVVDVVDDDRLGAGTPPALLLRVGDDQAPVLEFRLRGIGASITAAARIPGQLTVRDDFGLRSVSASFRAVVPQTADKGQPAPPDVAFEPAIATFGSPLPPGARRHTTAAQVDLLQWNPTLHAEQAPENRIRPGMLLSLRFHATDNFGPGEPHETTGEVMVFGVVTRERLAEELRRRQVEQRQELQRIRDDEQGLLLELTGLDDPATAGERRPQIDARLHALVRRQLALGARLGFLGDTYQRLIWEYENNRLWDPANARQQEQSIPAPLHALAQESCPASARHLETFASAGGDESRAAAVASCRDVLRRIELVLQHMAEAESIAALLEDLRAVIRLETDVIRDVQDRVRTREADLFTPKQNPADAPPKPVPGQNPK